MSIGRRVWTTGGDGPHPNPHGASKARIDLATLGAGVGASNTVSTFGGDARDGFRVALRTAHRPAIDCAVLRLARCSRVSAADAGHVFRTKTSPIRSRQCGWQRV